MTTRSKLVAGLILAVVLGLAYHYFLARTAVVYLHMDTSVRTLFKIYYHGEGSGWSERRVGAQLVEPGTSEYRFRLTDLDRVTALRIDPLEKPGEVTIHSLTFKQHGYQPVVLGMGGGLQTLQPLANIDSMEMVEDGLRVNASHVDGQLLYQLEKLAPIDTFWADAARFFLIGLLSIVLVFLLVPTLEEDRFVLYFGFLALGLIMVMAGISLNNTHPDEAVHLAAGSYYMKNHLPPPIEDPGILHTYSPYGVSRLHSGEIAYFFAGKFAQLLEPLQLPRHITLRLFNVGLFAGLLLLAIACQPFRILMIPLLMTPQLWYIFSYFNSEAFAVFIVMLIAWQVTAPKSMWNRLIDDTSRRASLIAPLILGLLFGLLLVTKLNFYFFPVFLGGYLIWRVWFDQTDFSWFGVRRLAAVAVIGLLVFGGVRLVDEAVNDFDKSGKLFQAREHLADHMFKPSTPLEKKHVFLQMKDRGVTLTKILVQHRWGEHMFRSSFGEYGYMNVAGSFNYYDTMRYGGLVVLLGLAALVLLRGGWAGCTLLGWTAVCSLALMGVALYHNWAVDYQAQGRYFLPILGMASILLYHVRQAVANLPGLLLFALFYCLSVYSYIFIALAGIGKTSAAMG